MIRVKDLQKSYGPVVAVDRIDLEVRQGETLGLLGPNGAGKTTTLHLMIGALKPDSGTVEVNGARDTTRTEARRSMGVAPQTLSLYEDLTVAENLEFFGRLYGLGGEQLRARVLWALDFAGLEERRSQRVGACSGGMQRRLNLACAMVHDPRVLFLDEPTAGVDPQSRNHIFERIEQLQVDGRTILYTTHYMEEAQRLCDRVAIMDQGRILALDTVDALIRAHRGASVVEAVLERPPEDPGAFSGHLEGTNLRIETDSPLEEVARLSEFKVKLLTVNIRRPDLETVFLALTGRRLRD